MNSELPAIPRLWQRPFVVGLFAAALLCVGVMFALMFSRYGAANQLRRMGAKVPEQYSAPYKEIDSLFGYLTNRKKPRLPPPEDYVLVKSDSVESLDAFGPALRRYRPTVVQIEECSRLRDVMALGSVPSIRTLIFLGSSKVTELPNMSAMRSLETLVISDMPNLNNLPKSSPSSVRELRIANCSVTDYSPLQTYFSLERLVLENCDSFTDADALKGLSKLTHLTLSDCENLSDVRALHGLKSLRMITINRCGSLEGAAVTALHAALPAAAVNYDGQ